MGLIFFRIWSRLLLLGFFGEDHPWRTRFQMIHTTPWKQIDMMICIRTIIAPILYQLCKVMVIPYAITWGMYEMISYMGVLTPISGWNINDWSNSLSDMMIYLLTPLTIHHPTSSTPDILPIINTTHPIYGPITWSTHWITHHPILSYSYHDTFLYHHIFLIMMCYHLIMYGWYHVMKGYHTLQRNAYEQRWMIGKTLKNVNVSATSIPMTANTAASIHTPTTSIPMTPTTASMHTPTSSIPTPIIEDEHSLEWSDDHDEKHHPSLSTSLHTRHVFSSK